MKSPSLRSNIRGFRILLLKSLVSSTSDTCHHTGLPTWFSPEFLELSARSAYERLHLLYQMELRQVLQKHICSIGAG